MATRVSVVVGMGEAAAKAAKMAKVAMVVEYMMGLGLGMGGVLCDGGCT